LAILEHVLLGTPASPLRKILLESGLGEGVVGRGLINDQRQMAFSTGMRGVEVANVDQLEALIISALNEIASDGIDAKTIEASINTIEFSLRENNTGPYPRGLILMLRTLSSWLYDRDPIAPIAFQKTLDAIKLKWNNGNFRFEDLIKNHLLNNNHRVTVILTPDRNIGSQKLAKEKQRLSNIRAGLDENQIDQIIHDTLELKRRQDEPDSPEALATIPMLTKDDLDPKIKVIPNQVLQTEPTTILFHDLFTSDILYVDLAFNLKLLSATDLPFMRLFMRSLLEMGTNKETYIELIQRIGRETGGISTTLLTSDLPDKQGFLSQLILRSKVMSDKVPSLLSILTDILTIPDFTNKDRFKQILLEEKSGMEAGIIPSGHRVVNNRLRAQLSESAWVTEQMSGIDYLFFIRSLVNNFDQEWERISSILEEIKRTLLSQNNLLINITIDQQNLGNIKPLMDNFVASLPHGISSIQKWETKNPLKNEGLIIPAQVNFVGKGGNLFDLGYKDHGSMSVITQYLRSTWLWEKIRVQGGAYGAMCNFDRFSGVFTYVSYRDPNILETINNFDQSAQFLTDLMISENELTKSIIGAIGDIDAYQLPDAKGYSAMLRYLLGISDDSRQKYRDELLKTSQSDFQNLAMILAEFNKKANTIVLGSSVAIDKANDKNPIFSEMKKIL
ncbi:MAG TPA: insulinase family protein, partial [Anaerolineaceae bacterium]|nr:insulinase family protein [Anaerolineaceae bacterium]